MALTTVLMFSLFKTTVLFLIISPSLASECKCSEQEFNTRILNSARSTCMNCYEFVYDFTFSQEWTPHICVSSSVATRSNPLLVVVRESVNVMSFEVPSTLGENDFSEVCHTLCPLQNNFDDKIVEGKQKLVVDVSSKDVNGLYYNMTIFKREDFRIHTGEDVTMTLTPSIPKVFQYNFANESSFTVEANSSDDNCMIVAVENITCPFHDTERTVEHGGFYQTSMKKAGVAITKRTFNIDRVYIVLILNPTNEDCIAFWSSNVRQQYSKEVTVRVIPNVSSKKILAIVLGSSGLYLAICLLLFGIFYWVFKMTLPYTVEVEIEEEKKEKEGRKRRNVQPETLALRNVADVSAEDSAVYLRKSAMCKAVLYIPDLSRTDPEVICQRSKLYKWNLMLIGIFYGLPVAQLVLMNQNIVNITGNQDLCYYNYLCANQLGIFSDSSHVFSNLGYIFLGILALVLVYARKKEFNSVIEERRTNHPDVETGIPHQFGLLYAMGWALIMEGVLSGCYHICPNWTNYQFDMTYMYVISAITMLKLFQSRHPDITPESHVIWTCLAIVIVIEVLGIIFRHIIFWFIFAGVHLLFFFIISMNIYFMGQCTINTGICQTFFGSLRNDESCHYKGRLVLLILGFLINLAIDIAFIVERWGSLGFFILVVCLANVLLHFLYYCFMKYRSNERLKCLQIILMLFLIGLWPAALVFFKRTNIEWAATPAESRNLNGYCKEGLNYFDDHDIWHMTSSFALFFTFMLVLTIDDDIERRPRNNIPVF